MSPDRLDPKALASIRRDAMRQRARRIRRSVTGLALALFTAAFVAIYVQLASGHDPALSTKPQAATTPAASEEPTSGESTGTEESTSESSASGSSEEPTESPSAVTSRQS